MTLSEIFIRPILFGPNILKSPFFAILKTCFSKSLPSDPDSLNPPERIVAHLTFFDIASLIASIILLPLTATKI